MEIIFLPTWHDNCYQVFYPIISAFRLFSQFFFLRSVWQVVLSLRRQFIIMRARILHDSVAYTAFWQMFGYQKHVAILGWIREYRRVPQGLHNISKKKRKCVRCGLSDGAGALSFRSAFTYSSLFLPFFIPLFIIYRNLWSAPDVGAHQRLICIPGMVIPDTNAPLNPCQRDYDWPWREISMTNFCTTHCLHRYKGKSVTELIHHSWT